MSNDITFVERTDKEIIERGLGFAPKFDSDGLITAVAQDSKTGEILMIAYMNETSLRMTLEKNEAVYFSRSRQKLWHKGESSGHVQLVEKILTDCDQDALVLKVTQKGPGCCHAGYRSCFYRRIGEPGSPVELEQEIADQSYDPDAVYG